MATKNRRRQKTIHYRGIKYVGISKAGKVHVYAERTARGQQLLAGTFYLDTKLWGNRSKNIPLPQEVQRIFQETFS